MSSKKYLLFSLIIALFVAYLVVNAQGNKGKAPKKDDIAVMEDDGSSLTGHGAAISTVSPLATEVGMDVLESGGNAVDAAVAVSYVLSVIEPYSSGVGGGGGMLIQLAGEKEPIFVDYREISDGQTEQPESLYAIPGFVYGMDEINKAYGTMSVAELIEPAYEYAKEGFPLDTMFMNRLERNEGLIRYSAPHLYEGHHFQTGQPVVQPELAKTLLSIQEKGADYFYTNILGESDLFTHDLDTETLRDYLVVAREPVKGTFLDSTIYSAPAPFAGSTLIQILEKSEGAGLSGLIFQNEDAFLTYLDIVTKAYDDRLRDISDPRFASATETGLLASSASLFEGKVNGLGLFETEAPSTTHFSIVDKEGNMVSVTNTIGDVWGTGEHFEGFFLNNALYNFAKNSKSVNKYEPYKKARTFMAPSIMENEESTLIVGTPGGNRIPQVLAQVLIDYAGSGDIEESMDVPRVTISENTISFETGQQNEFVESLREKGYGVNYVDSGYFYGGVNAVQINGDELISVTDYRRYRQLDE